MRVLSWFSCGDASAVAAKLAIDSYGEQVEICYCDTLAHEHPDNIRFLTDVERWLDRSVTILHSPDYADIYDVFRKTRWLVGPAGARCTTELKKNVRRAYERPNDLHVFGFTAEEAKRIERFGGENPELQAIFPLMEHGLTKAECHRIVREAGIELPAMYRLGYRNNNCIGCVKGGLGYWNKIRVDFPEAFERMAKLERELDAAINKTETREDGKRIRHRLFLDELPPERGHYEQEPDIECGVLCHSGVT
ncbi:MAG: hypothetical protein WC655_17225 [Candidatus Hydrogenedentales bacterium]|jgi:hypothetical protein